MFPDDDDDDEDDLADYDGGIVQLMISSGLLQDISKWHNVAGFVITHVATCSGKCHMMQTQSCSQGWTWVGMCPSDFHAPTFYNMGCSFTKIKTL